MICTALQAARVGDHGQRRRRLSTSATGRCYLDNIFSLQWQRTVNRDNTVSFENLHLQIEAVPWRGTLADCTVATPSPKPTPRLPKPDILTC